MTIDAAMAARTTVGRQETEEERTSRIARERAIIADGRDQLDAGEGIGLDALKAWLKVRRTDAKAPLPVTNVSDIDL